MATTNKPNKWLAGVIALLLSPPFGLLYAAKLRWAIAYFVGLIVAAAYFLWIGSESVAIFLPLITLVGVVHAFIAAMRYPVGLMRPWYSKVYSVLGILFSFFLLVFVVRAFLFEPFRAASSSMLPTIEKGKHVIASKWGYGNKGTYGFSIRKSAVTAPVRHGDVLVFIYPRSGERLDYLMRVVGLPGDVVEYKNRVLAVNGHAAAYRDLGEYNYVMPTGAVSALLKSEDIGLTKYRVLHRPDLPAIFPESVSNFPSQTQCQYLEDGFNCRIPEKHYFMMGDNRDASNDSRYWGFVPEDHIVGKVINLPQ